MQREVTISLDPKAGAIDRFYAFVDQKRVIARDGDKKQTWKGKVPSGTQVQLKVRVSGIGAAKYELGIDLPGTADDQKLTFTLTAGYHEIDITF